MAAAAVDATVVDDVEDAVAAPGEVDDDEENVDEGIAALGVADGIDGGDMDEDVYFAVGDDIDLGHGIVVSDVSGFEVELKI